MGRRLKCPLYQRAKDAMIGNIYEKANDD